MIKRASWSIVALMLSAQAWGAGPELFIRGGFNGWGLDHALADKGSGVLEVRVELSPGYHPFKVGNRDWTSEWVVNPDASTTLSPGANYRMVTKAGPENYLFVKTTAPYLFRIDLTDKAAPVLHITRLEPPATAVIDPHLGHALSTTLDYSSWDGKREVARFSTPDTNAALRRYAHSTTLQLRDPGPQHALYKESASLPYIRTGNLAFDALFALAGAEMKQNSVSSIKDGNYNGGAPIACECFETGEKWHYVWTRDLSYAADLGLAMLDPQRVRNSLDFKLSGWRDGVPRARQLPGAADALQIIQDTGSGGSWPVSTDRVSWAFGAARTLDALAPAERQAFAPRALLALSTTIENDRLAAFDSISGLYTGEQSFLDWREQSYASWIVNDLASMASAKALSTNVAHYKALTLAASLATEQNDKARAGRYAQWAVQLKKSINQHLWLPDAGMYSSLTAAHFDGAPMYKFDWLGQALAIITGIADEKRTRSIMARYPHGPMGAPVIYPQQMDVPVYHNRAIWPFVTAYGLKAAAIARHAPVADAAYATLIRGAALNLSNMENLEWLTGQPLLLDEANPALIGPVINSRRQLWSVGAYLGMVIENVFGVSTTSDGIDINPFITARLRRETFGESGAIVLHQLRIRGKTFRINIELPAAVTGDGYYPVNRLTVNGNDSGRAIRWDSLKTDSVISVTLGDVIQGDQSINQVQAAPYAQASTVFAPREPVLTGLVRTPKNGARLTFAMTPGTLHNVYRNGKLAAANLATGTWTDSAPGVGTCYAVEAVFAGSGNRSHHSQARCLGSTLEKSVVMPRWGKPADVLAVDALIVPTAGKYQLQVKYRNTANEINLGISGGVKWMAIKDGRGKTVARGVVQMPHSRVVKGQPLQVYSTPLAARLRRGKYSIELSDFYNMSYLQANRTFSAAGGASGPSNIVDIEGVRLTRVD